MLYIPVNEDWISIKRGSAYAAITRIRASTRLLEGRNEVLVLRRTYAYKAYKAWHRYIKTSVHMKATVTVRVHTTNMIHLSPGETYQSTCIAIKAEPIGKQEKHHEYERRETVQSRYVGIVGGAWWRRGYRITVCCAHPDLSCGWVPKAACLTGCVACQCEEAALQHTAILKAYFR